MLVSLWPILRLEKLELDLNSPAHPTRVRRRAQTRSELTPFSSSSRTTPLLLARFFNGANSQVH